MARERGVQEAKEFLKTEVGEKQFERFQFAQDKYSNGETTLQILEDNIEPDNLYLLDEPEVSLSPQNQVKLAEEDKVIMDLPVKPDNAKKVLDVLYDEPIVSRKKILELVDIKPTTLNVCINALKEKNIIIETTGYSRNQVFAFQKYIDLFLK